MRLLPNQEIPKRHWDPKGIWNGVTEERGWGRREKRMSGYKGYLFFTERTSTVLGFLENYRALYEANSVHLFIFRRVCYKGPYFLRSVQSPVEFLGGVC